MIGLKIQYPLISANYIDDNLSSVLLFITVKIIIPYAVAMTINEMNAPIKGIRVINRIRIKIPRATKLNIQIPQGF